MNTKRHHFLRAAAVKHLFHAAHNCPPWQDAPPAPSWRLFHKHFTTAALFTPAELHVQNGYPIHSSCNPTNNGLTCWNNELAFLPKKSQNWPFNLMLTKLQRYVLV
jgi:hypothetical protein